MAARAVWPRDAGMLESAVNGKTQHEIVARGEETPQGAGAVVPDGSSKGGMHGAINGAAAQCDESGTRTGSPVPDVGVPLTRLTPESEPAAACVADSKPGTPDAPPVMVHHLVRRAPLGPRRYGLRIPVMLIAVDGILEGRAGNGDPGILVALYTSITNAAAAVCRARGDMSRIMISATPQLLTSVHPTPLLVHPSNVNTRQVCPLVCYAAGDPVPAVFASPAAASETLSLDEAAVRACATAGGGRVGGYDILLAGKLVLEPPKLPIRSPASASSKEGGQSRVLRKRAPLGGVIMSPVRRASVPRPRRERVPFRRVYVASRQPPAGLGEGNKRCCRWCRQSDETEENRLEWCKVGAPSCLRFAQR